METTNNKQFMLNKCIKSVKFSQGRRRLSESSFTVGRNTLKMNVSLNILVNSGRRLLIFKQTSDLPINCFHVFLCM